jgi:hypothetical protein
MAKWVSNRSAERWNKTASIVEGGGAGWYRVPGKYRPPRKVGGDCEELSPGSYRGVCGATIAPGESGPVIVTGCDGDETLDAVNHSNCTFYLGDRITVNVDPCCNVHFTGCSCCEPPSCCAVQVCIGEESAIIAADSFHEFSITCGECEAAVLKVSTTCTDGVLSGSWELDCDDVITSGSIEQNWNDLCDAETDTTITGFIDVGECLITYQAANFSTPCPAADTPINLSCETCTGLVGAVVTVSGIVNGTWPGEPDCNTCSSLNKSYFLTVADDAVTNSGAVLDLRREEVFCNSSAGGFGPSDYRILIRAYIQCISLDTSYHGISNTARSGGLQYLSGIAATVVKASPGGCEGETYSNTRSDPSSTDVVCDYADATITVTWV